MVSEVGCITETNLFRQGMSMVHSLYFHSKHCERSMEHLFIPAIAETYPMQYGTVELLPAFWFNFVFFPGFQTSTSLDCSLCHC